MAGRKRMHPSPDYPPEPKKRRTLLKRFSVFDNKPAGHSPEAAIPGTSSPWCCFSRTFRLRRYFFFASAFFGSAFTLSVAKPLTIFSSLFFELS